MSETEVYRMRVRAVSSEPEKSPSLQQLTRATAKFGQEAGVLISLFSCNFRPRMMSTALPYGSLTSQEAVDVVKVLAPVQLFVVIPARNEQDNIGITLASLTRQTLKPIKIVVVNDGSTDQTAEISARYADTINLPSHDESYVGRPELARILNTGLERVPDDCDYVLILGADHSLPEKYVESTLLRMIEGDVKIASGHVKGEPYHPEMPRGTGRIYDFKLFKSIGFFPVNWGWESYVPFKVMQMGYRVKCYREVDAGEMRATSISRKKLYYHGKAMRALGYDFKYALGRAIINRSSSMLKGYLSKDVQVYKDVAEFVRNWQTKIFWGRMEEILRHKGRK